ncbi:hypothetical protein KAR91_02725 [Candidatus Pacearchaeota archaeon]|nr:hypothetical protein [Candidatus Pacearchaeota archaeon]
MHVSNGLIKTVKAQELIPCPDGSMADPSIGCTAIPSTAISTESNIAEIILSAAGSLMTLVAAAAVVFLMMGGVRYALAAGDDEKLRKAKRMMIWSLVGLAVSLLARTLAYFIIGTIS